MEWMSWRKFFSNLFVFTVGELGLDCQSFRRLKRSEGPLPRRLNHLRHRLWPQALIPSQQICHLPPSLTGSFQLSISSVYFAGYVWIPISKGKGMSEGSPVVQRPLRFEWQQDGR